MSKHTRWRPMQFAVSTALALAVSLTLSGCFMIPVMDGRSPFDDPFGTSRQDLKRAIPVIEAALKDLDDSEEDWLLDASPGESFSCEGACQLRVDVTISPAREDQDLVVPPKVLWEVLRAAVPAAEAERVDLNVYGWYSERGELGGDYTSERAEMADAVDTLFGDLGPDPVQSRGFKVEYKPASVIVYTKDYRDVLTLMGLK